MITAASLNASTRPCRGANRPWSAALRLGAAAAMTALAMAPAARAGSIGDPANDFLPGFVGSHDSDLDIVSVAAWLSGSDVILSATLNGAIGGTANALYVWGIDRGAGTARFGAIAPGVLFDAVAVLTLGPGGTVNSLSGPGGGALSPGAVTISGSTITAVVPLAFLPSTGFAVADYGYSFWPRAPGAGNSRISDFAPNSATFKADVPEPQTWVMLCMGLGLAGAALRRHRAMSTSA